MGKKNFFVKVVLHLLNTLMISQLLCSSFFEKH